MPGSVGADTSGSAAPRLAIASRWTVLALMVVSLAAASTNATLLAPLAPFLVDAFEIRQGEIGLATSAFYAGTAGLSLVAGWLNDRFGVRATLGTGLLIVAGVVLALSQAPRYGLLVAGLFVAGAGYSVVVPSTTKALIDWFPPGQRARVVAVNLAAFPVAGALTAALLPHVAFAIGWRGAIQVVAPLPLLCGLVALLAYRHPTAGRGTRTRRDEAGSASVLSVLVDRRIFALAVASTLLGMQQATLITFLVLYFVRGLDWPIGSAGALLAVLQVSGVVARLSLGQLGDTRFLHRRTTLLAACGVLSTAACVALALYPRLAEPPLIVPVAVAIVGGTGALGWTGLATIVAAEQAGPGRAALAASMPTTGLFLGWVLGPALAGLALSASGFGAAWLLAALCGAAALGPLNYLARARSSAR